MHLSFQGASSLQTPVLVHCVLFSSSLLRHTVLLCPMPFVYAAAVNTRFIAIPRASFAAELIASACSMATAHSCSANSFRMYCRIS